MKASIDNRIDPLALIDTAELAQLSGLSESAIRKASSLRSQRRSINGGITIPRITRIGNLIKFRRDHVKEWLDVLAGINIDDNDQSKESTTKIIGDRVLNRYPGRPRKIGGQK